MINLYNYVYIIIYTKHFSERKKNEQHSNKYSSEIKTKRVKYCKPKHKHHKGSELKPTDNHLANESPQHAIKLFVSIDNLKNFRIIEKMLYLDKIHPEC